MAFTSPIFFFYPFKGKEIGVSAGWGPGFAKTRGCPTCVRVCFQNQLRNLATAVQVSIDTAVQHCEVMDSVVKGGNGV